MDEAENNTYLSNSLDDIDHYLWKRQQDLATLREAVQQMRQFFSPNVEAHLRGDDNQTVQTRQAHTNNTPGHDCSRARKLDSSGDSEFNGFISELMEASTTSGNEISAHITEDRPSTASYTDASTDAGACGAAGRVAHTQQFQSVVLMGPVEKAKESSEKQRVGLRRSPRQHGKR